MWEKYASCGDRGGVCGGAFRPRAPKCVGTPPEEEEGENAEKEGRRGIFPCFKMAILRFAFY